jgi:DNA-binding LacI/PurR family transcriptional regulator
MGCLPELAARHEVAIEEAHVQAVDQSHPVWAEHVVQLLCRGAAAERPDALVVADDNLFAHACRGLVKSGLTVGGDIDVVAHANFPLTDADILPVARLGYDIRALLTTAMGLIDRQRQGEMIAERTLLPAQFLSELDGRQTASEAALLPLNG